MIEDGSCSTSWVIIGQHEAACAGVSGQHIVHHHQKPPFQIARVRLYDLRDTTD